MKTIDIEFDKPRKLRYDVNSIDYIEQTIGKPFAKIDLDNLFMREIAALIAGGLMILSASSYTGCTFFLGESSTNVSPVVNGITQIKGLVKIPIPTNLQGADIWFVVSNNVPGDLSVAGFGLSADSGTQFENFCGVNYGSSIYTNRIIPPSWIAFGFGLDTWYSLDNVRAISNVPNMGGWPSRINGNLRWCENSNANLTLQWSDSASGPWTNSTGTNLANSVIYATNKISTSNEFSEYLISTPNTNLFYRFIPTPVQ